MDMKLEISDAALKEIASVGFDPVFGARPLKRTIQRRVLDPLAMKVHAGEFSEGDGVVVDVSRGSMSSSKPRRLSDTLTAVPLGPFRRVTALSLGHPLALSPSIFAMRLFC